MLDAGLISPWPANDPDSKWVPLYTKKILLATPWSPYNYKPLATFKSMMVAISGFFPFWEAEGGGASNKLNYIIKVIL